MGLGADSSVATWAGGLFLIGSAIASAAYANDYCRAFESNPRTPKNQNHAYYTSQYVRVLGSLTAGFAFLYVVLVFIDSRHPAKSKMWAFSAERLQKSRLQAKKAHMQKLAAVEGILTVMWLPPAFILAFVGWIYERQTTNGVKVQAICTPEAVQNCKALQGVGVATIITLVAVVLLFIITLLPCTAKPGEKTPEQKKKEEEDKKKKEAEEDRKAGNRIRRAFGLPELSEAEYADMIKAGNNGSQQCWGFRGFPTAGYGGYYSTAWGQGAPIGAGGGMWAGWGGGMGYGAGGGPPIVLGAGAPSAGPQNIIDVNFPVTRVFSRYPRHNSRRRYRTGRRYYRLVPGSVVSTSSSSSASSSPRSRRPPPSPRGPTRGPPPAVSSGALQLYSATPR